MELTAYTLLPLPNLSGLSSARSAIDFSDIGNRDAATVTDATIPMIKSVTLGKMNSMNESEFKSCFSRNARE